MKDELKFGLCVAASLFTIVLAIWGAFWICAAAWSYTVERPRCRQFAEISSLQTKWALQMGCMVRVQNGDWMSQSTYEARWSKQRLEVEVNK